METHHYTRYGPSLLVLLLGLLTPASAMEMKAFFDNDYIKGEVVLAQMSENNNTIEGFHKFEKSSDNFMTTLVVRMVSLTCEEASSIPIHLVLGEFIFNSHGILHRTDTTTEGVVFKETDGVTLFVSDKSKQPLRSLLIVKCAEGPNCGDAEEALDCAEVVADTFILSNEIIIILIVAGILLLLLFICIPIICCCIRRRRQKDTEKGDKLETQDGDGDSIDDPFLMNGKQSKSEISIPYMDASLPPTPKGGRSGFRLEDLLGNNNRNSTGSISEKPM